MRKFMVMWRYEDEIGIDGGFLPIYAKSREDAETKFYKYNSRDNYECEAVVTYEEWVEEGSPERL